jgi:hypothetical protein
LANKLLRQNMENRKEKNYGHYSCQRKNRSGCGYGGGSPYHHPYLCSVIRADQHELKGNCGSWLTWAKMMDAVAAAAAAAALRPLE